MTILENFIEYRQKLFDRNSSTQKNRQALNIQFAVNIFASSVGIIIKLFPRARGILFSGHNNNLTRARMFVRNACSKNRFNIFPGHS